ncbi:MAG TPA: hypothetical protein VFW19_02705 [Allosphingosinicella sp.]|nr:hypothetical protein [Allosphingosinicella sp.]
MLLKIKRSQRTSGVVSSSVVFCLDARVELTSLERRNIQRYKLYDQVIYNSEASKRHLDKAAAQQDGTTMGSVKGLASLALAAMRLNVTVKSLERGQHIECKSMDEVIGAENALMTACQNLKEYLETAALFDGREHVVDFSTETPTVVAEASPAEELAAPLPPHPDEAADFEHMFGASASPETHDAYEGTFTSGSVGAEAFVREVRDAFETLVRGETPTSRQWKIIGGTALVLLFLLIIIFR